MAFTNFSKKNKIGNTEPYMATFTVSGDNAYATGGTAGFAAYVQANLEGLTPVSGSGFATDGSYTCEYNVATNKLMVFDPSSAAEASAGDLSAKTFQVTIWCK